jgi:uncharacterized protein YfaS (alpha-2-macroglobulin family)
VKRTYKVNGQPVSELPDRGLVEVVLEFQLGPQTPDGCYQITDHLPSGLKPVTKPAYARAQNAPPALQRQNLIAPYRLEGQKVSFCASKGGPTSLTYLARPTHAGAFKAEPAIIHNQRAPSILNLSTEGEIKIVAR